MRRFGIFVGLALGVAFVGVAQAQDEAGAEAMDPPSAEPMAATSAASGGGVSSELVKRGVQGPAGQLSIRTLVGVNASSGAFAKPFSIAPDVFYAVNDKLQVGLLHNGPMGWQTDPGLGLCLAGKENGCGKVWDNVGFDVLYSLMSGETDLSAHGTVYINTLDPLEVGVTLGVAGKAHLSDQLAIWFDPQIYVGVTERDFNKEIIYIPVEVQYQLQPQLALVFLTGLVAPLDGLADFFVIPVGVAGFYNVNEMIDVGARFSFDNMLGKGSSADFRSLSLLVNVRP